MFENYISRSYIKFISEINMSEILIKPFFKQIVSIVGSLINCILDLQFIQLKPINLVKYIFSSGIEKYIFLMDGHKCLKLYILMHKYIADIVFIFIFSTPPPLPPNFCQVNFFLHFI